MLFTENLEEIIFQRHNLFESDEFVVISGYVGPKPIERLHTLPFRSKVVYGMYGAEGIQKTLHNSLVILQDSIDKINIFYSHLPVHSKCYAWRNKGHIVHALVGSANFSTNGLRTPFREVLAETTIDTFFPLNEYIDRVLNNSISCLELSIENIGVDIATEFCFLTLLGRDNEVQNTAGLNWGQNPNNHTTKSDAYIKIRVEDIRNYPELFPQKQLYPLHFDGRGRMHRHNDTIEIMWDDGVNMDGLLFGNQKIDGILYPKQVTSFPHASEMGLYFRKRLGVPIDQPIRKHHLLRYGRFDVAVSKIGEGVYKFDFSV